MKAMTPPDSSRSASARSTADVQLVHEHQTADDRVERPIGRGGNVGCFESHACQATVLDAAVRGVDVSGVSVDAQNVTGRDHRVRGDDRNIASA
jgi:hypothetical protein